MKSKLNPQNFKLESIKEERRTDYPNSQIGDLLRVEDVVKITGLSKSYIYKLTCAGILTYFKPNGKILYFRKDDLYEWLTKIKFASNSEISRIANSYSSKI